MPLLTDLSGQNSAFSSKLPYICLVTRNPTPLVAVIVPSSTFQSASPVGEKPDSERPSNSSVQPAFDSTGLSVLFAACWPWTGRVADRRPIASADTQNADQKVARMSP